MKRKRLALTLALLLSLTSFSSCASSLTTEIKTFTETVAKEVVTTEEVIPLAEKATETDLAALSALYGGRTAYFGDIHCHPMAGVAKDGRKTLSEWKTKMDEVGLDFVAFMNHKQIAHMLEADWDDTLFIGGTEPGTRILDSSATDPSVHYNMLLPGPEALHRIVTGFPEYQYTGGKDGIALYEGTFSYPRFERARFQELIEAVKREGGLFVNVHPKQQMQSSNPEDYFFADYTGLEVFYGHGGSIVGPDTKENYKLWRDLLSSGKRLWATAGSDSHGDATAAALTCVFSEAQKDEAYLSCLAKGDFVCGFAGIQMAVGESPMGSSTSFEGKRVVFSVGAVHEAKYKEGRSYTVLLYAGDTVVAKAAYNGKDTVTFALDAEADAPFYRVEVLDEKRATQPIIAIGNPIWND